MSLFSLGAVELCKVCACERMENALGRECGIIVCYLDAIMGIDRTLNSQQRAGRPHCPWPAAEHRGPCDMHTTHTLAMRLVGCCCCGGGVSTFILGRPMHECARLCGVESVCGVACRHGILVTRGGWADIRVATKVRLGVRHFVVMKN